MASAPASGVTVGCTAPRIVVIGAIAEPWETALSEACASMRGLADIDQRASVVITGDDSSLTIDVTTANGREATRRCRDPQTLRDTLEALLAVPVPQTPSIADTPQTSPAETPAGLQPVTATREHTIVPTAGVGLSGRMASHGRHILGPTAFAGVHIDDWLLGGSLRWDALEDAGPNTASHYETDAIAAGITIGRRVTHGSVDTDLAFEPRLITQAQAYRKVDHESGSTTADFWFAGVARAAFGPWPMRPYVQADVEVAPSRLRHEFVTDTNEVFKPLPSWSVGLALGVAWDVR